MKRTIWRNMRRTISVILVLIFCLIFLCSCSNEIFGGSDDTLDLGGADPLAYDGDEFRAAWLSYYDLSEGDVTNESEYNRYLDSVFSSLKKIKINNVFVHVRPFADSFYPSKIFDTSKFAAKQRGAELSFDIFGCVLKKAKQYGMKTHAWINPYRVQSQYNPSELHGQIAEWVKEKSRSCVKYGGGLYLNPAERNAKNLVLSGVQEILDMYDVDGIHIDDYFYPTDDPLFDSDEYAEYREEGGAMSQPQWRRENVSSLVRAMYKLTKSYGENKTFSVSPCGDIEKNIDTFFADVKRWAGSDGYCDLIIPQIYYGFENSTLPFKQCVEEWKSLCGKNVKLAVGLALYKAGKQDEFAGEGKNEWLENDDVVARQIQFIKEENVYGFSLFSAGNVNFDKTLSSKETQNIYNVLSY